MLTIQVQQVAEESGIHPRQIPILHEVFTPTAEEEIAWAREVISAFDAAPGDRP